jgi:hypothetical protein
MKPTSFSPSSHVATTTKERKEKNTNPNTHLDAIDSLNPTFSFQSNSFNKLASIPPSPFSLSNVPASWKIARNHNAAKLWEGALGRRSVRWKRQFPGAEMRKVRSLAAI